MSAAVVPTSVMDSAATTIQLGAGNHSIPGIVSSATRASAMRTAPTAGWVSGRPARR